VSHLLLGPRFRFFPSVANSPLRWSFVSSTPGFCSPNRFLNPRVPPCFSKTRRSQLVVCPSSCCPSEFIFFQQVNSTFSTSRDDALSLGFPPPTIPPLQLSSVSLFFLALNFQPWILFIKSLGLPSFGDLLPTPPPPTELPHPPPHTKPPPNIPAQPLKKKNPPPPFPPNKETTNPPHKKKPPPHKPPPKKKPHKKKIIPPPKKPNTPPPPTPPPPKKTQKHNPPPPKKKKKPAL